MKKIFLSHAIVIALFLFNAIAVSQEAPVSADEGSSATETMQTNGDTGQREEFQYESIDRADPFMPFITERTPQPAPRPIQEEPDEIIESTRLTGMQLFEPSQLTLVAVMFSGTENIAMVQDSSGQGYIIKEGMLIGKHGTIVDISNNGVLIEEVMQTRRGRTLTNEISMLFEREVQ
ncbi:MAG: pilus assembly protein PilP [Desulfofustis sp. PB-SRB1]|jgi:Tfp pilus assembly protein PilP|nr:pilus assembly protein PilP [Desulfofustis sp. PB-SRB1]MBM1000803.1 pilus assembly protein PilP [Desulfofustis sp. PB-SRB1]HBH27852.1 hypothetical protein [Desulfofustis sp.]HBH30335.1 hypothetical protein [Desulfofustis sp.]